MKYLIMECHPGYAVVLDEEGRFIKAANMHYQVGQSVTEIFPMEESSRKQQVYRRAMRRAAALAACVILGVTAVELNDMTYGSVFMSINPEVRIDVNWNDTVVDIEDMNDDGEELIEDYSYRRKKLDQVMDELVDRAIDQGYLSSGGQITLSLDGRSQWTSETGDELNRHLNEYLTDKVTVTIQIENQEDHNTQITIPALQVTADVYSEGMYGEVTEPVPEPAPESAPESDPAVSESQHVSNPVQAQRPEDLPDVSGYKDKYKDGVTDYSEQVGDAVSNYAEETYDALSNYDDHFEATSDYDD